MRDPLFGPYTHQTLSSHHESDDSEFVTHQPCPKCGSSDANGIYSDGHTHCFSCGHHTVGAAGLGTNPQPQGEAKSFDIPGEIVAIKRRHITEETCRKFGVRYDADKKRLYFPYPTKDQRIGAVKYRHSGKEFSWFKDGGKPHLFGQQLWGTKGKSIVITEGELDCLSVFQVRPTWPVVSLPNGAHSAYKDLSKVINLLDGFEEIVLFFDNDDQGQEAATKAASLFDPKKVFIAYTVGYKDANEALMAGDSQAILQALWQKKQFKPRSIVEASTLRALVSRPITGKDASYHIEGLNEKTSGLRLGELVTVTAGSGVGKSTFCGELASSLIEQGHKVGYIALEESVQRTALRLMTVKAGRPLHEDNSVLSPEEMNEAFDATLGSGRLFLRDGFGSVDPDEILSDCRYLVRGMECKWIILDHLSILMSGSEIPDERKLIDLTMTRLRSFVEEVGCGLILISHLKRPQGDKGHEDGGEVHLGQLRGSHSIAQLSDIVLALERNLSGGSDTAKVRVLKNRFNGKTGPAAVLQYNELTGRQTEDPDAPLDSKEEAPPTNTSYF